MREREGIGDGEATKVMQGDNMGRVTLTTGDEVSEGARRAVKKVKVRENQ